jgi:hypothetical protein
MTTLAGEKKSMPVFFGGFWREKILAGKKSMPVFFCLCYRQLKLEIGFRK